ncbi:hypothetical protein QBC36DRAFT_74529 [Triangularia setosa]|uniref:Uncharacterized protein n=1 Tax=Triangularia setosa TaxID=2587417 RepID=A0AAN6WCZ1_9PEZI|nr:hypothetical protein QBC36DRAFT_74529 [Podospora setosa]
MHESERWDDTAVVLCLLSIAVSSATSPTPLVELDFKYNDNVDTGVLTKQSFLGGGSNNPVVATPSFLLCRIWNLACPLGEMYL